MLKSFLACLTLLCAVSAAQGEERLLVVGDSLSAAYGLASEDGWVALLEDYLSERGNTADVINASISGETSQGGLARLPGLLQTHQPTAVIIELGANDGMRGFPLQLISDNLRQMIRQCRDSGASVLLVGMHIPPNYGAKYTSMFHDSFQQLAQQEQVALVPFLLEGVATREDMMQADGLHPTAGAQPRMLQNVLPGLLPLLGLDSEVAPAA